MTYENTDVIIDYLLIDLEVNNAVMKQHGIKNNPKTTKLSVK